MQAGGASGTGGAGLRIALGIHRLEPRGGLEDNCLRIADELAARGHAVVLFVAGPRPDLPREIVSLAPPRARPSNHARAVRFARDFVAATAGRFDRTVSFQPVPGADVLFLADWLRDRPDTPWWKRLTPRFRAFAALERSVFSPAARTRVIGLSPPQLAAFRDRYGTQASRLAVLPPSMEPAKRRPERRTPERRAVARGAFGVPGDAPVWLWLGLQPKVKGLDRVLDALARDPAALLLVGGLSADDARAASLRADADRRGLAGRVVWLGYLSGDALLDAVAAADLLAHPARLDVTGGVVLEALVNGLPVVASAICGFAPLVVESGAGRVVPEPFVAGAFSAALAEVSGPANAALSAAGIAYGASNDFTSGTRIACDLIEADAWTEAVRSPA